MSWFRRGNASLAPRVPEGGLRRYLETPPQPKGTRVSDALLLAVDLETTGLDPRSDHIVSMGMVDVVGLKIPMGSADGYLVSQGVDVGQSAVFHQLTDDRIAAEGVPLEVALDRLFAALAGKTLLAHHAPIEEGFLRTAVASCYGVTITIPTVDTMSLGLKAIGEAPGPPDEARLWRLRHRSGLPSYRGHDATTDALACAELYLALAQELGLGTLGDAARA